ncbi:hypothetical protein [Saccharothrix stipae]
MKPTTTTRGTGDDETPEHVAPTALNAARWENTGARPRYATA